MHVATVELILTPDADVLSSVRRFITDLYNRGLDDADFAQRIGVATHELLENAIKYTTGKEASISIVVKRGEDGVFVCTSNHGQREDIERVISIVQCFRDAPDKLALYRQMLRDAALQDRGSGLGLARICAELEMTLSSEVEGDIIRIYARALHPGAKQRV